MQAHATNPENSPAAPATELLVSGMTCNNCARHVTEAIQSVPGCGCGPTPDFSAANCWVFSKPIAGVA
jgi:copper chaperone CopZ